MAAQLDRLLAVLVGHRGDALRLTEGDPATMLKAGGSHPLTKQPLSASQLVALLREIAPADVATRLDAGLAVDFRYGTGDGAFLVNARRTDERWHAELTIAARPNGANGSTPSSLTAVRVPAANAEAMAAARASVEALLREMTERRASDLHLRCGEPPILRIDGEMVRLEQHGLVDNSRLEGMLDAIMPDQNRHEYADCHDTDFAYEIDGLARFRGNALRDRKGAAAVFRLIPAKIVTVEQMGLSPEVQALCYLSKGLVLVTGPTGSGKSTTLSSLIDLINRTRSDHIVTIEDPIEFVHPNKKCLVTQRQVGVHTSSFKRALRAALREDPDIVLVGELRDLETTSIAIETAETGHLVFATMHTTTASSTIDRVIDQFAADRQAQIRTMLSESLRAVIAQTLCKKIGGGRAAAREILLVSPAVSNLIREGKTFQITSVIQTSRRSGMITLNDALLELVESHQVEAHEAYLKAVDKSGMAAALRAKGHDLSFLEVDAAAAKSPTPPSRPVAARR